MLNQSLENATTFGILKNAPKIGLDLTQSVRHPYPNASSLQHFSALITVLKKENLQSNILEKIWTE